MKKGNKKEAAGELNGSEGDKKAKATGFKTSTSRIQRTILRVERSIDRLRDALNRFERYHKTTAGSESSEKFRLGMLYRPQLLAGPSQGLPECDLTMEEDAKLRYEKSGVRDSIECLLQKMKEDNEGKLPNWVLFDGKEVATREDTEGAEPSQRMASSVSDDHTDRLLRLVDKFQQTSPKEKEATLHTLLGVLQDTFPSKTAGAVAPTDDHRGRQKMGLSSSIGATEAAESGSNKGRTDKLSSSCSSTTGNSAESVQLFRGRKWKTAEEVTGDERSQSKIFEAAVEDVKHSLSRDSIQRSGGALETTIFDKTRESDNNRRCSQTSRGRRRERKKKEKKSPKPSDSSKNKVDDGAKWFLIDVTKSDVQNFMWYVEQNLKEGGSGRNSPKWDLSNREEKQSKQTSGTDPCLSKWIDRRTDDLLHIVHKFQQNSSEEKKTILDALFAVLKQQLATSAVGRIVDDDDDEDTPSFPPLPTPFLEAEKQKERATTNPTYNRGNSEKCFSDQQKAKGPLVVTTVDDDQMTVPLSPLPTPFLEAENQEERAPTNPTSSGFFDTSENSGNGFSDLHKAKRPLVSTTADDDLQSTMATDDSTSCESRLTLADTSDSTDSVNAGEDHLQQKLLPSSSPTKGQGFFERWSPIRFFSRGQQPRAEGYSD